ncbi:hypothetical protein A1O3_04204 [Capronia epimyces CBS 606.96]|uniref:BZIP domain-containing protein n=1 Tax=Capronia epimyces CBS 606.96 TaxID=1182542 RepID=W9YC43_9EURO|nr:uncharacterized protein A1O3_04204 [Capronia epimyces CBS 606.96]EXJ87245.1 hypothetical protein A1O3_04204 [Capronia epimyces CBS 606.96]
MDLAPAGLDLKPSPHLTEAIDHNDDWTGLSDPAARRKLQNKLNQRARRRRQAPNKWTPVQSKINDVRQGHQRAQGQRFGTVTPPDQPANPRIQAAIPATTALALGFASLQNDGPRFPRFRFPLSSDHLIHLIHHNVYRAMLTNMVTLRITPFFTCEPRSSRDECGIISALPLPAAVPPPLEPTALQQRVHHAAWIDLFPLPALRDVLIRAQGSFDEDDLCLDILGTVSIKQAGLNRPSDPFRQDLDTSGDRKGIVVWGEPWSVSSWEVEEGFVKKWGWLIGHGCEELHRSTNKWRWYRGAERIDWTKLIVQDCS